MSPPSTQRAEEWDILWRYARNHPGLSSEWVRLIAQMLAMARLFDGAGMMDDLRNAQEWTTHEWLELVDRADALWRQRQAAEQGLAKVAVSPFAESGEPPVVQPGQFEVLRQLCLDLVSRRNVFGDPHSLLSMMLELAQRADGGRGGEFFLPSQTSELLALLTDAEIGDRALCAFSGAGEAAMRLGLRGVEVVLQVPRRSPASFWACLAAATNLRVWVQEADPFEEMAREWSAAITFDLVVVVPPWGGRMADRILGPPGSGLATPPPTTEAWGVSLAARRARRVGVCLVPSGFLFKSSALDQQFKDRAIHEYGLRTVVGLPAGAGGFSAIRPAVVILQRHRASGEVLMIDHSDGKEGRRELNGSDIQQIAALVRRRENAGSSRLVPFEELVAQQLNLSPERYVLTPDEARLHDLIQSSPSVPLEELADIYRPQATTSDSAAGPIVDEPVPLELSVSDLDEVGLARTPNKRLSVSRVDYYKLRRAELRPGDVLLVTKGSVGRVGYVGDISPDEYWVANQSFAILRLRRNGPLKDSRVLFRFLSSPTGYALLQRLRVGTTIPGLQMGDIKRLPILVPSLSDQHRIVDDVERLFSMQAQFNALRSQVAEHQLSMWPEGELGEAR
jgi:type I restriction enzyme M protein